MRRALAVQRGRANQQRKVRIYQRQLRRAQYKRIAEIRATFPFSAEQVAKHQIRSVDFFNKAFGLATNGYIETPSEEMVCEFGRYRPVMHTTAFPIGDLPPMSGRQRESAYPEWNPATVAKNLLLFHEEENRKVEEGQS